MLPDIAFGYGASGAEPCPWKGVVLWNITMRGATDRAANDNKLFTITAVTNGGTGARPVKDGLSATACPGGVRGTPVEINETVAPIVFLRIPSDSGGAGAHRGGLGQVLKSSAIGADFELLAAYDRIDFPARGRNGGLNGETGSLGFTSGEKLRGKGTQTIPAGKIARFHTPGGAGFGDPKDRDSAALSHIENGLITKDAAARDYGYVSAATTRARPLRPPLDKLKVRALGEAFPCGRGVTSSFDKLGTRSLSPVSAKAPHTSMARMRSLSLVSSKAAPS